MGTKKFHGTFEQKREHFRDPVSRQRQTAHEKRCGGGRHAERRVDSSSIISVIGRDFPSAPLKTFTIYYEGRDQMDERAWASQVVSAYPNLEPIITPPSNSEVAECFEAASKSHDVRCGPRHGYALLRDEACGGKKGQGSPSRDGADEYLAGYWPAYDRIIGGMIKKGRWLKALKLLEETRQERSLNLVSAGLLGLKSLAAAVVSEETIWRGRALFQFSPAAHDQRSGRLRSPPVSRFQAQSKSVPCLVPHFPSQFSASHGSHVDGGFD